MAEPARMKTKSKPTSVAQMGLIIFTSIVRRVVRLRQGLLLVSCRPGGSPKAEIRNPNPREAPSLANLWRAVQVGLFGRKFRQFSFIDFAEKFFGFTRLYQT